MADRLRRLALTVPIACAALGCGSDKVLLRYHPKANTTHRYTLDEQMKVAVAGASASLPARPRLPRSLASCSTISSPER